MSGIIQSLISFFTLVWLSFFPVIGQVMTENFQGIVKDQNGVFYVPVTEPTGVVGSYPGFNSGSSRSICLGIKFIF